MPRCILELLVVTNISDQNRVVVSRISDREDRFGNRQLSFSSDGNFTVLNSSTLDLTPLSSPSDLVSSVTFEGGESSAVRF